MYFHYPASTIINQHSCFVYSSTHVPLLIHYYYYYCYYCCCHYYSYYFQVSSTYSEMYKSQIQVFDRYTCVIYIPSQYKTFASSSKIPLYPFPDFPQPHPSLQLKRQNKPKPYFFFSSQISFACFRTYMTESPECTLLFLASFAPLIICGIHPRSHAHQQFPPLFCLATFCCTNLLQFVTHSFVCLLVVSSYAVL